MQMAKRLENDAMDKKEPGDEVRPTKVGKDNNSWQKHKKRKNDKHVHEKFEPKSNNAPKGESRRHGRPVSRPKTRMGALDVAKRAT